MSVEQLLSARILSRQTALLLILILGLALRWYYALFLVGSIDIDGIAYARIAKACSQVTAMSASRPPEKSSCFRLFPLAGGHHIECCREGALSSFGNSRPRGTLTQGS
jgi:hypothetical protein